MVWQKERRASARRKLRGDGKKSIDSNVALKAYLQYFAPLAQLARQYHAGVHPGRYQIGITFGRHGGVQSHWDMNGLPSFSQGSYHVLQK